MSLAHLKPLVFHEPDFEKFPLLKLAFDVGKMGGAVPLIMNAANEAAVQLFLDGKISFVEIAFRVMDAVEAFCGCGCATLEEIVDLDHRVKLSVF